jgi:hypothetical protein
LASLSKIKVLGVVKRTLAFLVAMQTFTEYYAKRHVLRHKRFVAGIPDEELLRHDNLGRSDKLVLMTNSREVKLNTLIFPLLVNI